jgi:hypothetical protein
MKKGGVPSRETAETLAIQAFGFLAEEPERLGAFLATTGIEPTAIRAAAKQPDFLAGVLEHMLGDEILLIAFADRAGIDPSSVAQARQVLGRALGGNWERDVP